MQIIIQKYGTNMTSLGFNCCFMKYIRHLNYDGQTKFFDWMGSSMKSIVKAVTSDFKDVLDYEYRQEDNGLCSAWSKHYDFRYYHEFPRISSIEQIDKDKINQAIARKSKKIHLFNKYQTSETMIFFRLEAGENYKRDQDQLELEYVKEFSELVKQKNTSLKYLIVYVSQLDQNEYLADENILILKRVEDIVWETAVENITRTFNQNREFIESVLS